jgi:hypothetical protein
VVAQVLVAQLLAVIREEVLEQRAGDPGRGDDLSMTLVEEPGEAGGPWAMVLTVPSTALVESRNRHHRFTSVLSQSWWKD